MAQIKDERTLTNVLAYCLEQEHFADSKADIIREAWARAQQQGDNLEDNSYFTKELAKKYGPGFPSTLDRFCTEYFLHVAATTKTEAPKPAAVEHHSAPVVAPTSQHIAEEAQRQREGEIKKSSSYRSFERILTDCVLRRKVEQREADLFLKQLLKQGDERVQIAHQLGDRMVEISRIIKGSEMQMKHLAVDAPMLQGIFAKVTDNNEQLVLTPESCVVLCDGLQKHLKNIIESVVKLAEGRNSTSTLATHKDILNSMSNGEVGDLTMSKVAMKWGPSVGTLLLDEDAQSKELYRRVRRDDEKSLEDKMKQVEESLAANAGTKRKSANDGVDLAWWKKDEAIEKEGKMSWQQLAESQMKLDLAKRVGSGPTISVAKRKEMQKKFQMEEEERKKLQESGADQQHYAGGLAAGGNAAMLVVDDAVDHRMDVETTHIKRELTPKELFQQQYELVVSRPQCKITKEDVVKVLEERTKIRLRK